MLSLECGCFAAAAAAGAAADALAGVVHKNWCFNLYVCMHMFLARNSLQATVIANSCMRCLHCCQTSIPVESFQHFVAELRPWSRHSGPMPKIKLSELVGQCPVSYAGLSRIIAALRDGVPEASSREAIARAIRSDLSVPTPCGPLMHSILCKKSSLTN